MDAVSDPSVETVVVMKSAQVGGTEIINNIVGYYVDQDPSPILVVQPTLDIAKAWSKDRLAPMLRDTPSLRGKVKDVRTRDSGNNILHKSFAGGHITVAGANSPASLASRPVRIVLNDEVDRYPPSAGTEGDPVNLSAKRATTFWNRKKILVSTPTIKDASVIEAAYLSSDQRKYYVPCPHCGTFFTLKWAQVIWTPRPPEEALYYCEEKACGKAITHVDKLRMVREGHWRAEAPFNGIAGFFINELYSPWVTFAQMAATLVEAKKDPRKLKLQTFVNTSLAETWDQQGGDRLSDNEIYNRREEYGPKIPEGAAVITAGVDVQDDRIEVEVTAWGKGEESWSIEFKAFQGSPARPEVWADLDAFLQKEYRHESGIPLRIVSACIDSGGHHTKQVYSFCKKRFHRRIYASKGSNQPAQPLVGRPTTKNIGNVKLFPVGTDTAKSLIYARLKIEEFGPGFMHFPKTYDEEYFKQLTAEKIVTKYNKGFASRVWVKTRPRNEALDCRVLAMAALDILNANLDQLTEQLARRAEALKDAPPAPETPTPDNEPPKPPTRPRPPRGAGFATGGGRWGRRR